MAANEETYVQVGVTALRDPKTGELTEQVPMYVKVSSCSEDTQQGIIDGIANVLARKYKEYVDKCRAAGVSA